MFQREEAFLLMAFQPKKNLKKLENFFDSSILFMITTGFLSQKLVRF